MAKAVSSRRGKSATLTPEQILVAADRLARKRGWHAVSMRQLATELGVTPMALYWHFENRSQLGRSLVERSFSEFAVPEVHDMTWRDALYRLVASLSSQCDEHAHVLPLLSNPANWPNSLAVWTNRVLRTLADENLSDEQVGAAHSLLIHRALMPGLYQNPRGDNLVPGLRAAIKKPPGGGAEMILKLLPTLAISMNDRFDDDMNLLLDGLEKQIEAGS